MVYFFKKKIHNQEHKVSSARCASVFSNSARMWASIHHTQAPIGTFKLAFFIGKAGALLLLKAKCSIIGDASLQGSTHTPENKS
jgi:hypothetical protein